MSLSKGSLGSFESDFRKLKEASCKAKFILLAGKSSRKEEINPRTLTKQIIQQLDGRMFSKYHPKYIAGFAFRTMGNDKSRWHYFNLLWRMKE